MIHADLLKRLLPPSSVDPNGPAISAEIDAEGGALDSAQGSAIGLLLEADPRQAALMLTDWERVAGLPDSCLAGAAQSTAERRIALVTRLTTIGGQSPVYFIALVASLGYAITITEFRPHTTEHDSEHAVTDESVIHVWQVNSVLYSLLEKTSEDDTEMATEVWGNGRLECAINHLKPAHTHVIFSYT